MTPLTKLKYVKFKFGERCHDQMNETIEKQYAFTSALPTV